MQEPSGLANMPRVSLYTTVSIQIVNGLQWLRPARHVGPGFLFGLLRLFRATLVAENHGPNPSRNHVGGRCHMVLGIASQAQVDEATYRL